MRRIFLIILAVAFFLGIGVAIYFGFFVHKATLTGQQGGSFPSSGNTSGIPDTTATTQDIGVPLAGAGTDVAPHLIRVSDRPVALGSIAVYVPPTPPVATTSTTTAPIAGTEPDVRIEYIERESGNIYEFMAHARTLTRLTNKTLPGIQEATWLANGSLAYARFLATEAGTEHIDTYALPANGNDGYFLEPDLEQVLAKGSTTLATLLSTTDGSSFTVSSPSGAGVHTLFTSPLSSIRAAFAGNNYVVTTKGSASADGYAFLVDGKTGSFTRALGPLQGMSTLPSPDGHYLLYSYLDNTKLALAVLDTTTHVATRLPVATLPEKCTWTADSFSLYCGVPTTLSGTLPDDWYQGAVSFTDRLWRIDMASRVATLIIDPKEAGNLSADMVGLSVDGTSDVLIFTNRRDGLLYVYDL